MTLETVLSHISTIRGALDALEEVAAAIIPGAAPVVEVIQAVETAVLGAVDAPSDCEPQTSPGPSPREGEQVTAHDDAPWAVTDLTEAATVLHIASRADCEAWADANCAAGFSIRPYKVDIH